jgi:2-dehydropantoate 2-reductase
MRIAVMGAGGVGGYFGAKLAQAGNDVAFVARGRHLAAMREHGLTVRSATGDIHLANPRVTDDPETIGPVDLVLFAVKLWDTEAAAKQCAPLVRGRGVVIPLQNGVESIERVGAVLGREHVMGGVAFIAATIAQPGVIAHTGTMARLRIGVTMPSQQAAADAFAAACRGAGIDVEVVPDIRVALWAKFAFLVALSGLTSLSRKPVGVIRADADMRAVFEAAIRESWMLARAKGVALPDDYVAQQLAFADGLPHEMTSSMANDLAAGNRLEAPWLAGAVVRMARESNIAVPVNATVYAVLKPYVDGAAR